MIRYVASASLVMAEQSGDPNVIVDARIFARIVVAEQGNLDDALRLTSDGVQLADEVDNTLCSLAGNFFLGDQHLRRGEAEDAVGSLRRSRELAEYCDAGSIVSLSDAWLSAARAALGSNDLASFEPPLQHATRARDNGPATRASGFLTRA